MRRLAILPVILAACASSAPPTEPEAKEPGMFVNNAEMQQCVDGGGCVLVTKEHVREALAKAFERGEESGKREAKSDCWANTSSKL